MTTVLRLKATDALRKVLENTDLAYGDEGDVLHVVTDSADETFESLKQIVDVERILPAMSFAEFQATRTFADRAQILRAKAGPQINTRAGFLYAGNLLIESTVGWHNVKERYYLMVDRSEYLSNDLEQLEHLLYDWALDSGAIQ